jgi:hypothetical protein
MHRASHEQPYSTSTFIGQKYKHPVNANINTPSTVHGYHHEYQEMPSASMSMKRAYDEQADMDVSCDISSKRIRTFHTDALPTACTLPAACTTRTSRKHSRAALDEDGDEATYSASSGGTATMMQDIQTPPAKRHRAAWITERPSWSDGLPYAEHGEPRLIAVDTCEALPSYASREPTPPQHQLALVSRAKPTIHFPEEILFSQPSKQPWWASMSNASHWEMPNSQALVLYQQPSYYGGPKIEELSDEESLSEELSEHQGTTALPVVELASEQRHLDDEGATMHIDE